VAVVCILKKQSLRMAYTSSALNLLRGVPHQICNPLLALLGTVGSVLGLPVQTPFI
jgi:hypothetical protein